MNPGLKPLTGLTLKVSMGRPIDVFLYYWSKDKMIHDEIKQKSKPINEEKINEWRLVGRVICKEIESIVERRVKMDRERIDLTFPPMIETGRLSSFQ